MGSFVTLHNKRFDEAHPDGDIVVLLLLTSEPGDEKTTVIEMKDRGSMAFLEWWVFTRHEVLHRPAAVFHGGPAAGGHEQDQKKEQGQKGYRPFHPLGFLENEGPL